MWRRPTDHWTSVFESIFPLCRKAFPIKSHMNYQAYFWKLGTSFIKSQRFFFIKSKRFFNRNTFSLNRNVFLLNRNVCSLNRNAFLLNRNVFSLNRNVFLLNRKVFSLNRNVFLLLNRNVFIKSQSHVPMGALEGRTSFSGEPPFRELSISCLDTCEVVYPTSPFGSSTPSCTFRSSCIWSDEPHHRTGRISVAYTATTQAWIQTIWRTT